MDNLIDILRLIRTKNVGNITFFTLIKKFGSAKKALESIPVFVGRSLKKPFEIYPLEKAEKEIETCKKLGIHIITYQDFNYPTLLHQIENKPPILFAKGNLNFLGGLPLSVVGSRKASLNGAAVTTKLVKELTELQILIVSGMALGIDTCAHKAALNTGTVAFLGSGINVVFPPENKELYQQIIQKGLVLSTVPVNGEPIASNFPKRNNYMAGMSLGVLVIEARIGSGSLITANCALEHGREVFAVPGNPNDPNSQGCNKLLKEGAILVENIGDMLGTINRWRSDMEGLREEQRKIHKDNSYKLNDNSLKDVETLKEQILPLLSYTPTSIDLLKQEFNSSIDLIDLVILELELLGVVERTPGNKIKLVNN